MEWLGNTAVVNETQQYLWGKKIIENCVGYSPSKDLKETSRRGAIAASDLKLGVHFSPTPDERRWLREAIEGLFVLCKGECQLMRRISLCSGSITAKLATLVGTDPDDLYSPVIVSEADLRYAVAEPIMEMLCNCWRYQVTNCIETFATATVLAPTDET